MNALDFDISELHAVQLELLKEFDRVCKENDIHYFLAQGTLIGAIRHKGFVPWDDDIDVIIPYEDFGKLQSYGQDIWAEGYFLQFKEVDPEYNKCYMRLRRSDTTLIIDNDQEQDINHGIAIDIYPLIHLADKKFDRTVQYLNTMFYMLLQEDHIPKNHGFVFKIGAAIILPLIPKSKKKTVKQKLMKKITKFNSQPTKQCYVIDGSLRTMKQTLHTSDFEKTISVPFEDAVFYAPVGYDRYLTERYGKYMELPPEDQQGVKLEHFVKIDPHKSYLEYKGIYYCKEK